MLVLFRAVTYATLFIALVLVILPRRVLSASGVVAPERIGALQVIGLATLGLGAALAVWCILTFALLGKGTPAPFDPPRNLVTAGPYRWVRNPMYVGAGLALLGAALFFGSTALFAYALVFGIACHLFVRFYEEPTLRRMFGAAYEDYSRRVNRWLPRWSST